MRVRYRPRLTVAAALMVLCASTVVGCGDGDVMNALTETTTEWIPTIQDRYPVLADLELDTAERTLFHTKEGTIGPLGDPTGPRYSQHYAPRPGFTVDDTFDELVTVLEDEGWGPIISISTNGRLFCAEVTDPTHPGMVDKIRIVISFPTDDPNVSFRFRLNQYPCPEPQQELQP